MYIFPLFLLSILTISSDYVYAGKKYPNALPDHRVAFGKKNIAEAWFSNPTTRYQHFVLGSNYEAAALNIKLKNGKTLKYELDQQSVFEDRIPRLADINNDGKDEIIVVRAYLNGGAALSVFQIKQDKISLLAETPDMGHPNGWLNPAGIADFDGDGNKEIAFVRKPHVLGRLELWQYKSGKLIRELTLDDTSNHAINSKNLGLSAVADFNNDGVMDLALPSMDRKSIRFLTIKDNLQELSRKPLPNQVVSNFKIVSKNNKNAIKVTLANGKTIIVTP